MKARWITETKFGKKLVMLVQNMLSYGYLKKETYNIDLLSFFLEWHINHRELFNAKSMLLKEQ